MSQRNCLTGQVWNDHAENKQNCAQNPEQAYGQKNNKSTQSAVTTTPSAYKIQWDGNQGLKQT